MTYMDELREAVEKQEKLIIEAEEVLKKKREALRAEIHEENEKKKKFLCENVANIILWMCGYDMHVERVENISHRIGVYSPIFTISTTCYSLFMYVSEGKFTVSANCPWGNRHIDNDGGGQSLELSLTSFVRDELLPNFKKWLEVRGDIEWKDIIYS